MCQCPHGLVPHCYNNHESQYAAFFDACQCPHGLVPHCYEDGSGRSQILSVVSMPSRASTSLLPQSLSSLRLGEDDVNALTGLYLIVTQCVLPHYVRHIACVNALSGLYLIVTVMLPPISSVNVHRVSMPSRAYTSLLLNVFCRITCGIQPVSMPSRAYTSLLQSCYPLFLQSMCTACQCPLGLIPHCYAMLGKANRNMKMKCQCPLGLVPHFYSSIPDG